ncbi:MAG: HDOD domain-containing protein [Desulfobacterales bacterium]|nr:HDOD domain-containing protein [Desulfobacterales bacterium]
MTRIITITSGKGGVGKTCISVNLAIQIATLGYRTCLFDADLGLANVNILLGLYPEYNLEDVILSHRGLKDVTIRNHEGIDIIPGSSGMEKIANLQPDEREHLIQSFSELDEYDFLLFDTSAGISRNVISFCLASSEVIVVITPEITSLTDSYALLKILCLNGFKGSVRVVVNQCRSTLIAKRVYTKFGQTVKKFLPIDVVPLGVIVHDSNVEEAVKYQRALILLYPESNASQCIKHVAKRLAEGRPEDSGPSGMSSFWTTCFEIMTNPVKLPAGEKKKEEIAYKAPSQAQKQDPAQLIQKTAEEALPETTAEKALPKTTEDAPEPGSLAGVDKGGHIFKQIKPHTNLPTLPHIVLKLIEACNKHESTIENISQIVNKDASLSAKVMSIANCACEPRNRMFNIEEAMSFLGIDGVKTIAISAAAYSAFDRDKESSVFWLKLFWQHSLMCATLARLIAQKTSYAAPDEAFLSGILHDIGKLVLWENFPNEYGKILQSHGSKPDLVLAGETRLGTTHCEVGAWMINQWNPRSFMADAVLYHHEPAHSILDALPLVKIVFVANALCSDSVEDTSTKFKTAEEVFGLARSEAEELISLAEKEVKQVAKSLDIEVEPQDAPNKSVLGNDAEKRQDLLNMVREISLLQATVHNLLETRGEESILKVVKQGIQVLFDVQGAIFFLYDRQRDALVGNDLAILFQKETNLLVRSLRQKIVLDSFDYSTKAASTIMDKQLIRFLGKNGMLCLPMVAHGSYVGVIVLGVDDHHIGHLRDQERLLTMFANQAALALAADHLRQNETDGAKDVVKKIQDLLGKAEY